MSVSMAVKGENFSIVAADTRSTNFETEDIKDNEEKIFKYEYGWVANSGGVVLQTSFFKTLMNSRKIETRKQIHNLWLRSIKDVIDLAKLHGVEGTEQEMNSSQAFFSIGLEINSLDFAYGRRRLTGNSVIFNPPKKIKRIKALVAKYSIEPASVEEAIYTMACFLRELTKLTKWVSDTLDAGIVLRLNDELLFLHLRAGAAAIKKAYKNKTMAELLIVKAVRPTTGG